ncbi:MAG: O-antigen ligase family protein [Deltaproteobacteria bacterium]|nr:O-antigen ligase family protein [Deltaproteobacteria bacterium]
MSTLDEPSRRTRRRRRKSRGSGFGRTFDRVRDAVARGSLSTAALAGLALLCWGAPMMIGSIFGWSIVGCAAASVVVALLAIVSARRGGAAIGWHPVLLLFALSTAWTALALVPLPPWLLALLDPTNADVTARALYPLGIDRAAEARPFTLDIAGTRLEILKGTTYGLVALGAAVYGSAHGTRRLLAVVALGSLGMAFVALGHLAFGAEAVFGIYRPVYPVASPLLAPLLNANHLGGFLALGVPLAVGFAVDAEEPTPRFAWYAAAAVTATTTVLTLSRGAVASLFAGALLLGALLWMRRRVRQDDAEGRPRDVLGSTVPGIVALGAGFVGAVVYVGLDPVLRTLVGPADTSKLSLLHAAWRWALEHWAFGSGRGAFAGAFWRAAPAPGAVQFTHAEHLPAQWAAEWGLPAAVLFALVLLVAALRTLQPFPTRARELGAIAGLAALVLHNLVDFSLEIAGVTVAACTLVGALVGRSRVAQAGRRTDPNDAGRLYWVKLGAPLVAAVVIAVLARDAIAHDRYGSLPRLAERARDRSVRLPQLREEIRAAMLAHPADPFPVLVGATLAARDTRDPGALRWLTRAMELSPSNATPHLMAARFLRASGRRSQALVEYRHAARLLGGSAAIVVGEVASSYLTAEAVLRVVPAGAYEEALLEGASGALAGHPEERALLDARLLQVAPRHAQALGREIRRRLAAGHVAQAVTLARAMAAGDPESANARVLLARALVAAGAESEAVTLLVRDPASADEPDLVLAELARVHARAGRADSMRRAAHAMVEHAGSDPERRGRAYGLLAELEESMGNHAHALRGYERAHRAMGEDDLRWLQHVGRLSERLGDRARAFEAYRRLSEASPGDAQWRAAMERVGPTPAGATP